MHGGLAPTAVVVTGSGVDIVGTGSLTDAAGFVAPEVAAGAAANPTSDAFALGAVLVYAASGSGPFGTGSPAQLLNRALTDTPSADAVPDELRPVVLSCLSLVPEQRPTAAAIAALLSPPAPPPQLLVLDGPLPTPDSPPNAVRPRYLIPLCAAASALILMAALTFVAMRDHPAAAPAAQPAATEPGRAVELTPVSSMALSPDGRHAYVGHEGGTVSVIDTADNTVSTEIGAVAGGVDELAVSTDGTRLYAASLSAISVIDTASRTVLDTIILDTETTVGGIAAPRDGSRIYIAEALRPTVSVYDVATRRLVTRVTVNHRIEYKNAAAAVLTSDDTQLLVFATYQVGIDTGGDLVIIDTATHTVTGRIPFDANEASLASGSDTGHVYGLSWYGDVQAFDTIAGVGTVIADLSLPTSDLAVSPSGQYLFVSHDRSSTDERGRISVISRQNGAILDRFDLDFQAGPLAVAPDGRRLYVASGESRNSGKGWFTTVGTSRYN